MTEPERAPSDAVGDPVIQDRDRLREIADLELTSREVDAMLQAAAEDAARALDLPIGLVSVVLDEAQYFAGAHGLDGWLAMARGTPLEWSFCANAVRSGEPFVVENAETHPAVRENPLVTHDGIRSYAGVPLVTSRGHALGTLCVLGTRNRVFAPAELATLRALADAVIQRIEQRRR